MWRATNDFLARQKENFLRPPDPRRSMYLLIGGTLLMVVGVLIYLLSDWPYSSAAWSVVAGAAMMSMGVGGRLPASYLRLTVALRATAVALLYLAFVIYLVAQASAEYVAGGVWSFGFWFTVVGYGFFAFAVPVAALFGYGLGSGDEKPNKPGATVSHRDDGHSTFGNHHRSSS